MKNEAFRNNVDLYSADLSRWPVDLVKPALALMNASPEAKAYFDEALQLDQALRSLDGAENAHMDKPHDKLEAKIMQQVAGMAQEKSAPIGTGGIFGTSWKPAYIFAPGGGLMALLLIGFFVGFQPPSPPSAEQHLLIDAMLFSEEILPADDEDDLFDEVVY